MKLYIQLFRYSNAYADWMSIAMVAVCRRSTVTNPGKITLFSSRRNRIIMLISIRIYSLSLLIPTNFGVSSVLTSLFQFPFGFDYFWAGVSIFFQNSFFQILGEFGINPRLGTCYLRPIGIYNEGIPPTTVLYTTAFILPAFLIIASYFSIWLYMWNNHKYLKLYGTE